jgi:hypothetical protein
VLKETCYFWGIRLFTMKQVPRKHWYTPAKICEITFQKIWKAAPWEPQISCTF